MKISESDIAAEFEAMQMEIKELRKLLLELTDIVQGVLDVTKISAVLHKNN
jgi:hypothetical protein